MSEVEEQSAQLPSSLSEDDPSEPVGGGLSEPGRGTLSEPAGGAPSEPAADAPSEPAGCDQSEPAGDAPSEPEGCGQSEPAGDAPSEPEGCGQSEPAGDAPSESAGGGQSEPAGGAPSEPAGGGQNEPAGGSPSEPAGGGQSEPAGGAPSEPAGGGQNEPSGGVPSEPVRGTPSEPTDGVPSEPVRGTPSEPAVVAPSEPVEGAPSGPPGGAPSEPVEGAPSGPPGGAPSESVEGAPSGPPGGAPSESVEGAPSGPLGSAPSEPVKGAPSEPAGVGQNEPAGGSPSEPAGGGQNEPSGGAPSEPVRGTPSEPTDGVPSEPVRGTPSEPAAGAPSEPVKGAPSGPRGGAPGEPVKGAPSGPRGGAPREPVKGAPSGPPGGAPREPVKGAPSGPPGGAPSKLASGAPSQPEPQLKQQPPLCRFFSQGRFCNYGRRCRFLHQRPEGNSYARNYRPGQKPEAAKANEARDVSAPQSRNEARDVLAPQSRNEARDVSAPQSRNEARDVSAPQSRNEAKSAPPRNFTNSANRRYQNKRLCRYFASGYCTMEARCRFWHPEKAPLVREAQAENKTPPPKEKVERPPTVPEVIRAANVTHESASQLRKTEIEQLLKRFPKDKVIVQEREDGKVTYYRIAIVPTDPDWPFDLKEMEIMLEFPEDYPLEVFTIQIPEDQDLPSVMGRHVCDESKAWIQGKHATNQLIGKVELLFRPFLHWLDRNLERLFTEGARLLKRDIEAEKAGLEFVPYQQLQAAVVEKSSEVNGDGEEAELEDEDSDSWTSCEEEEEEDEDDNPEPGAPSDGMKSVEEGGGPGPRKGTEIRFIALKLGEGVGTLTAQRIVVSLLCNRCNITADLSMTGKQPCSAQCEKCNSRIAGTFLPSILHQYSSVLGYVDVQGAAAKELVLPECTFLVGCLNCSQEEPVQNLSFGVTKDLNCLNCHSKLSIASEAARFQKVQRFLKKAVGKVQRGYGKKKLRDPAIQSGKPLPDHGTCKHYRKSCRWFRFPCCGKAYACDVCHDEAENHIMDLATRMLCGYCAKEQPFNVAKPCISCGSMMNKNMQSAHWEGGRGCRSKVKMSRKDKQKHANCSKTVSRKSVTKK